MLTDKPNRTPNVEPVAVVKSVNMGIPVNIGCRSNQIGRFEGSAPLEAGKSISKECLVPRYGNWLVQVLEYQPLPNASVQ